MLHLQKAHLSHVLALMVFLSVKVDEGLDFIRQGKNNTDRLCTVVSLCVYHLSTDEI